jgi:hypothetical protein
MEEALMKSLVSILALGLAVAFTVPAFAADTPKTTKAIMFWKTKAACEKAGGKWDQTTRKCSPRR